MFTQSRVEISISAHVVTRGPSLNVLGRTSPENENTDYSAHRMLLGINCKPMISVCVLSCTTTKTVGALFLVCFFTTFASRPHITYTAQYGMKAYLCSYVLFCVVRMCVQFLSFQESRLSDSGK